VHRTAAKHRAPSSSPSRGARGKHNSQEVVVRKFPQPGRIELRLVGGLVAGQQADGFAVGLDSEELVGFEKKTPLPEPPGRLNLEILDLAGRRIEDDAHDAAQVFAFAGQHFQLT
jgi:hypothetical protein